MTLKSIVVIGNGPSLQDFDFFTLSSVDTLGMNAAYRYWKRIDWYPTHYCCLDPELIATHNTAIWHLVAEGHVTTAFLHGQFLQYFPEAAKDSRFVFLNQFNRSWYGNLGKRYGLPLIESPVFQTSDWTKVTTGAYAVRYAIHLGYQRIGLVGIDLRYVEQLPEATRTEGLQLVMEKTPTQNPNYFFADYQQAGDRFQVPNPEVHNFDLHPASFEVLRDDLVQQHLGVSVVNCNHQSELHARGIFPYRSLQTWLGQQALDALVVLTQVREGDRILKMLKLWQQPAFVPFLHFQGREKVKLIFTFTGEVNDTLQSAIRQTYEASSILQRCFHPPEFHFFILPDGEDVYVKDGTTPLGKKGFASGPNQQFFRTLFALHGSCFYALFIETDCLPLRPDWLGTLGEQLQTTEEFWVMGSHYRGKLAMFKHFARHMNGCAVYAVGSSEFIEFAKEWEAILDEIVAHHNPVVAYDSALDYFFYHEFMANKGSGNRLDPASKGWQLFQKTAAYFRYTNYILNYSDTADQDIIEDDFLRDVRARYGQAYLIHHKTLCEGAYHRVAEMEVSVPLNPTSSKESSLSSNTAVTLPLSERRSKTNFSTQPRDKKEQSDRPNPASTPAKKALSSPPQTVYPMSQIDSRKTLAIAFLAIILSGMGSAEILPHRWIFAVSGTALILFLLIRLMAKINATIRRSDKLQEALEDTQSNVNEATRKADQAIRQAKQLRKNMQ